MIQYRILSDSEVQEAAELSQRVFREFVESDQLPEGREEFRRYASAVELQERHHAGCLTFAAKRQGQMIGMLHLRNGDHIAMLFVEGREQRQGIGSGLVLAAEQYAQACQPTVRVLTVAATPNAIGAY